MSLKIKIQNFLWHKLSFLDKIFALLINDINYVSLKITLIKNKCFPSIITPFDLKQIIRSFHPTCEQRPKKTLLHPTSSLSLALSQMLFGDVPPSLANTLHDFSSPSKLSSSPTVWRNSPNLQVIEEFVVHEID